MRSVVPDPTIAIQASHAWCLNCNERVSNIFAQRHALVDHYQEGCGIEFKYVSTPATINREAVMRLRDDLEWRDVDWA